MQALKDTFYLMLRDRVAAGNPARVVEIRGVSRPGVVVAENELPGAAGLSAAVTDVFQMQWTGLGVDGRSGLPLAGLTCEISYATDGTSAAGGMDRGRALTGMDEELAAALGAEPRSVAKVMAVAGQTAVSAGDGTNVFWGDVTFKAAAMRNGRMERTATVEVFGYGE